MKLTVIYNGESWVGIIERTTEKGQLSNQYTFNSEPEDEEILKFVNKKLLKVLDTQIV